jgi:glycosyltransferase involved in cell wall biosynthesis
MVVDGETGFTIPVDDVDALTDRLVRLLSDSVLPRNMGRAGRLRAERYFTWPRVVERMTQAMTPGLQPELGKAWLGCFHILVASPATAA